MKKLRLKNDFLPRKLKNSDIITDHAGVAAQTKRFEVVDKFSVKCHNRGSFYGLTNGGNHGITEIGNRVGPAGQHCLKVDLMNNLDTGHYYKIANHPIDLNSWNAIDPVHHMDEFGQNMLMAEDRHLQMGGRFKQ
jgi:hypothetical protein